MSGDIGNNDAFASVKAPTAEASLGPKTCGTSELSHPEFLGGMSRGLAHDIQNLLTPISTCLQLLKASPQKANELVPVALKSVESLQDYVRQARWFSEHRSPYLQWVPFDLLLERAVGVMENRLASRQIKVEVRGEKGWLLQVDRVLLLRLISNLLANAIEASPAGSVIIINSTVPASQNDSRWFSFEVRDCGTGFGAAPVKKSSEGLEPVDEHGLGLAVCQRIVELHGGKMGMAQGESGGTVVRVDLPVERKKAD